MQIRRNNQSSAKTQKGTFLLVFFTFSQIQLTVCPSSLHLVPLLLSTKKGSIVVLNIIVPLHVVWTWENGEQGARILNSGYAKKKKK